jgi:hypothetical protein
MTIKTDILSALFDLLLTPCTKSDEVDVVTIRQGAYSACGLESVNYRHTEVEKNELGLER